MLEQFKLRLAFSQACYDPIQKLILVIELNSQLV